MVSVLIIIVAIVAVGFFVAYAAELEKKGSKKEDDGPKIHYYSDEVATKAKNMEKLETLISSGGDKFTNHMVQKELRVSAPTATKYLNELERQGVIRQAGENGDLIYYKKYQ